MTVWLTRDSDDDTFLLSDVVEVWAARPERDQALRACGFGAMWLGKNGDEGGGVPLERIEVSAARARFRTIPETDRECVRIEGERAQVEIRRG